MAVVATNPDGQDPESTEERANEGPDSGGPSAGKKNAGADPDTRLARSSAGSTGKRSPLVLPAPAPRGKGYFTIYKKGQGFWTRIGTVISLALIGALAANFIFEESRAYIFSSAHFAPIIIPGPKGTQTTIDSPWLTRGPLLLVVAFIVGYAALSFHLLNKPGNVDFLIATDSEMKKVNWTSRKELIGSTRVVILFMLAIAFVLFIYDLFFHTLFWAMHVLKAPPPLPFIHLK